MPDSATQVGGAPIFPEVDSVRFEGTGSDNPLAYRYYDPDRLVMGKRMADHLRMAVCYWHTFCWNGFDVFGQGTFDRSWHSISDKREAADMKMAAAFEFTSKLGLPYYTFHDVDVVEPSDTPRELSSNLARATDHLAAFQEQTGIGLLWGTAGLSNHRRYAAGALTNPDPENAACAIRQIRDCLNATHRLGGENYVLWGGREGYDTLLNTDLKRELENLGRFMAMVVEHKHKIGFKGKILMEPKPHEPMYHQYDFDTATVAGFLERFDLMGEVHVNIEPNHATLAGHSFAHEVAMAVSMGVMGSIDINCGNYQNGWDTDQFNLDIPDMVKALVELLPSGGLDTGGFNFDAKVRRQSNDPIDLFYGTVGAVDALAEALLQAAHIIEEGKIATFKSDRYAGWSDGLGRDMLAEGASLDSIADAVGDRDLHPGHRSGRQEYLENLIIRRPANRES